MGDGFKDFCQTGWGLRDAIAGRKLIRDKETELFSIDSTAGQLAAHFGLESCKLGCDDLSILSRKNDSFTQLVSSSSCRQEWGTILHCSCHDNIVVTMNTGWLEQKTLPYIVIINMNSGPRTKTLNVGNVRRVVLIQFIHEVYSRGKTLCADHEEVTCTCTIQCLDLGHFTVVGKILFATFRLYSSSGK